METRKKYDLRLKEAPSTRLWLQYAQWEASMDQVKSACIIFERYLASTNDPAEEMWLSYVDTAPSFSMKQAVLLRAMQQRPLSTNIYNRFLTLILTQSREDTHQPAELETMFQTWMQTVLEHGTLRDLEDLLASLVNVVNILNARRPLQRGEEIIFLILRTFITLPGAGDRLPFTTSLLCKLSSRTGIDQAKLFSSAVHIFTLTFPALATFPQKYEALSACHSLCEFFKQRLSADVFADVLIHGSGPLAANNSESMSASLYALLFEARSAVELSARPLDVASLCLILAYDSLLTLQIDDRVFPTTPCSVFWVLGGMIRVESWWEQMDTVQRLLASDLMRSRGDLIVATLRSFLSKDPAIDVHEIEVTEGRLLQLCSTIRQLIRNATETSPGYDMIQDAATILLSLFVSILATAPVDVAGILEGLLRTLLTAPQVAAYTPLILGILGSGKHILFEEETVRCLLNCREIDNLLPTRAACSIFLRAVPPSVTRGHTDLAVKMLVLLHKHCPYFAMMRSVVETLFSVAETSSPFNRVVKHLIDLVSVIAGDEQFQSDFADFVLAHAAGDNTRLEPVAMEDAALVWTIYLVYCTKSLTVSITSIEAALKRLLSATVVRMNHVYEDIKAGNLTPVHQYAKVSSLVSTALEFCEVAADAEEGSIRAVVTECWIAVNDGDRKRHLMAYEVAIPPEKTGRGLLNLLKKKKQEKQSDLLTDC